MQPALTTITSLSSPRGRPTLPDNPIGEYFTDPFGTLGELAMNLLEGVLAAGHTYGIPAAVAIGMLVVGSLVLHRWRSARLHQGARFVEILLPPKVEPDGAAAFWRNVAGLLHQRRWLEGRPHIAFEYRWIDHRLTIGLWVPGMIAPRLVEHAVQAAWPGARTATHHSPPPALGNPAPAATNGTALGGVLRLAAPEWYSLRTDHTTDPLRALLGAAEEHGYGETTVVQLLARPARGQRLARCRRAALALRRGQPPTRAGRLLDLLQPGPATHPAASSQDPARAAEVRAVLDKAAGPGWETSLRYGVSTATRHRPRGRVTSRAHAITAAFAVFQDRNRLNRGRLHRPAHTLEARRLGRGDLLSTAEIATLAHLPLDLTVPGVVRAGARSVIPTPVVPEAGKILGGADAGPARPVALPAADTRHHLHVMGATGSGKSTLLANLVLQDAEAGRGAIVIDPRGDLIRDLLERLPARTGNPPVLLDPDEQAAPPSLNMLEGDPELATDHVLSIFRRVFASAWGPRTDDVLRSACLTLLQTGPATLADVPFLLTDAAVRERHIHALQTRGQPRGPSDLRDFWVWYDRLTPAGQAQLIGPTLSRLRAFLLRGFVYDVVGATKSSFSMDAVLDGGILLARLPKGTLGSDASRLLGSMVVSKVWQVALERARAGERVRVDASLYVDEAHNFLHLPYTYEEMLAEARGYRLSLVLAHQHLAQLPKDLREAVSANARTKVWFTMSPEDARALRHHVAPRLTEHDLAHMGLYQAAARVVVDGDETPACTLTSQPLPDPTPGRAEELRTAARQAWGRDATQRHEERARRLAGGDTQSTAGEDRAGSAPPRDPRGIQRRDRGQHRRSPNGDAEDQVEDRDVAGESGYGSDYDSGYGSGYGLGSVEGIARVHAGQCDDASVEHDPDSLLRPAQGEMNPIEGEHP